MTVDVQRSGNLNVAVSVNYATSNGSALAGQDYTRCRGHAHCFHRTKPRRSFSVPILANPNRSTPSSIFNLTLSQPAGGAALGAISSATVTIANQSNPNFKTFLVVNTNDSGPGTFAAAIIDANADPSPGTDNIVFDIPASTAANLNVPVSGFDPVTQTWTITLASPLPGDHPRGRDRRILPGNSRVPFRYPDQTLLGRARQVSLDVTVTGGTYEFTVASTWIERVCTSRRHDRPHPLQRDGRVRPEPARDDLVGQAMSPSSANEAAGPCSYVITFQGSQRAGNHHDVIRQQLTGDQSRRDLDEVIEGGNPSTTLP